MNTLPSVVWQRLLTATQSHPHWHSRLLDWESRQSGVTLHLVILREPYLSRILSSRKRIESRFGRDRRLPFGRVHAGDILLLKRSGGPLAGLALVERAISRAITPTDVAEIQSVYGADLAIDDPGFWQNCFQSRYVTLAWMSEVFPLPAIPLPQQNRFGWLVVDSR